MQVRESLVEPSGMRAIDIIPMGGITTRLLPDRGLDVGQAWFGGVPLAWVSSTGESAPLAELHGTAWGNAFGGGLVVTCGLRNVGVPAEGHGHHGTFSHLPVQNLSITRSLEHETVVVAGQIVDEGGTEPRLEVFRTITVHAGRGLIMLEDVATNMGVEPAATPLLYHCNFGFPLWARSAQLELTDVTTTARDEESQDMLDSWSRPPPIAVGPERVLEHRIAQDAPGWARLSNPEVGMAVTLRWDGDILPIINQWLDPNPGMAVLGIEPSNCLTRGRAYDRQAGQLPQLDPGATRKTTLTIEASVLD